MKKSYVEVTIYKDFLIVDYKTQKSEENIVTPYDNPGNLGYVVLDVGHVSISKEAHNALSKMRKGSDCIGDIDIFSVNNGNYAFSTFGLDKVMVDVKRATTSRQFVVPNIELFQIIENNPPEGAVEAIDE